MQTSPNYPAAFQNQSVNTLDDRKTSIINQEEINIDPGTDSDSEEIITNVPHPHFETKPLLITYPIKKQLYHGSKGIISLHHCPELSIIPNKILEDSHYSKTLLGNTASASASSDPIEKIFKNGYTRNQKLVAVKFLERKCRTPKETLAEKEIQFILSIPPHANLIQIYDIFVDSLTLHPVIVMEPFPLNLARYIKYTVANKRKLSISRVQTFLIQILRGVRHIHRNGFVHKDLKPENILLCQPGQYKPKDDQNLIIDEDNDENILPTMVVKICDFGLSGSLTNETDLMTIGGSSHYLSPETILDYGHYDAKIDVWAFGLLAYELITTKKLFQAKDEMKHICELFQTLGSPLGFNPTFGNWEVSEHLMKAKGFVDVLYCSSVDLHCFIERKGFDEIIEFIKKCLQWDPKRRCTMEDLGKKRYFRKSKEVLTHKGHQIITNYCKTPKPDSLKRRRRETEHLLMESDDNGTSNTNSKVRFLDPIKEDEEGESNEKVTEQTISGKKIKVELDIIGITNRIKKMKI